MFTISVATSLGRFELVASSVGLRRVYWPRKGEKGGRRKAEGGRKKRNTPTGVAKMLKVTARQLGDYFDGRRVRFNGKLDLSGLSPFAQKVLRVLAKVRYGQTITYGELAKRAGSAKAARAVGNVLAKNPLPIIVPCHRVIPSNGSIGGFSAPGGLKLKRQLLLMEDNCARKETPGNAGG